MKLARRLRWVSSGWWLMPWRDAAGACQKRCRAEFYTRSFAVPQQGRQGHACSTADIPEPEKREVGYRPVVKLTKTQGFM